MIFAILNLNKIFTGWKIYGMCLVAFIFLVIIPAHTSAAPLGTRLDKLKLTSMCSPDPASYRVWRVRNPNPVDVEFTWDVYGTDQNGSGIATAASDVFFNTVTVEGANTTRLFVKGHQQAKKASKPDSCSPEPATSVPSETPLPTATLMETPIPTATLTATSAPVDTATATTAPTVLPAYQPLSVCWVKHWNGQGSTEWKITNPNSVPLVNAPDTKVLYAWFVFDQPNAQGNLLQSQWDWDNTNPNPLDTVYAQSLWLKWYLLINGVKTEILGHSIINADESGRCDGVVLPDATATLTQTPTPQEPTATATISATVLPQYQPLSVCWVRHLDGQRTEWRITNPNPFPLSYNPYVAVWYAWFVFDQPNAQGNVLEGYWNWEDPNPNPLITPYSQSIWLKWYLLIGEYKTEILSYVIVNADETGRCSNAPVPSVTPSTAPTLTKTATSMPSATNTPTATRTPVVFKTNTPYPTRTPKPTATPCFVTNTPAPTFTLTATYTPTATASLTATLTLTSMNTFTPTAMLTASHTPTATYTATFTPSASSTLTHTPTPTSTATMTRTPTATNTATFTSTTVPTLIPTSTSTYTATFTPSATSTLTHTSTATYTATSTATLTRTPTATNTATFTPSATSTLTHTPTATYTATFTSTATATMTRTPTATNTANFTPSATSTLTRTPTATYTATPTVTNTPTAPVCNFAIPASDVYGTSGLVWAINQANLNSDRSVICLTTSTYSLTTAQSSSNGLPVITTEIEIRGNGATINRASSAPQMRIFQISPAGNLTLLNLTLSGGNLTNADGGAILSTNGRLNLIDSTVHTNTARNGGAIYNNGGSATLQNSDLYLNSAPNASGGALVNVGSTATTLLINTDIHDNNATTGGGVYNADGSVTAQNSSLYDNSAVTAGGLFNSDFGQVTITDSILSGNTSVSYGGGMSTNGAQMTINDSCVTNNVSPIGSGIVNLDTGPVAVDARWNWWGSVDGPSGIASGSGDGIYGNVLYAPFETAALAHCVSGASATISLDQVASPNFMFELMALPYRLANADGN